MVILTTGLKWIVPKSIDRSYIYNYIEGDELIKVIKTDQNKIIAYGKNDKL